jgi:BlaI family penicillinase repressor
MDLEKLTSTEEAAMQAIWKNGPGVVKDFLSKHNTPIPPYTTLASTVKNLEKKGYIKSRKIGNVLEYTPLIDETQYATMHMEEVVHCYFDNSYKQLVAAFVSDKKLSASDLKEILKLIEQQS